MREFLELAVTRTTAAIVGTVAVAALIVAIAVAAGAHDTAGVPSADNPTRTMRLTLNLLDSQVNYAECDTSGTGYDDVSAGAEVTIVDRHGDIVSTGSLGEPAQVGDTECTFTAEIPDVNAYLPMYGVRVGNENRGTINDTRDELAGNGWTFELTLGD